MVNSTNREGKRMDLNRQIEVLYPPDKQFHTMTIGEFHQKYPGATFGLNTGTIPLYLGLDQQEVIVDPEEFQQRANAWIISKPEHGPIIVISGGERTFGEILAYQMRNQ